MWNSRSRNYLTKILIDIMFFGGIVACAALPFILPSMLTTLSAEFRVTYTIILLAAGLCSIYILFQLKRMFKTLLGGNPFVTENVVCLRKCAVAGALIALIFVVRIAFFFTIAAAIIVIIFAMLSLFCLTIKDLFKQAVAYKEDADWTV
jgi:membrane protease YdiL (CAAX protease family)